ncbi:DUF6884 domain-containing protein [Streptomyces goshikiensis]|uniref:DUF6884 domain-containing protein n=1 Tax=Streptomyces goshikiensis TaxID=1942 RepID=UPI00365C82BF
MNTITVPASERIVVIPCAAKKLDRPAPAGELFIGSYYRACRAAADALTANGGTVLILSTKYGLVTPGQILKPYEMTLGDRGAAGGLLMEAQARKLGLADSRDVTVLAGGAYAALARTVWPKAETPLVGLRIGQQLARLVEIRESGTTLTPEPAYVATELPPTPARLTPAAEDRSFTIGTGPLYGDLGYDYRQTARPFTVAISGPGRHQDELPQSYVVEAHNTEQAWARAMSWYLADAETVDAFVVADESFEGLPGEESTVFWIDLRPELARREALSDLADQAAELIASFRKGAKGLDVESTEYRESFTAAAHAAWPLLREVAAHDGRE